jgi:hypothetical protein
MDSSSLFTTPVSPVEFEVSFIRFVPSYGVLRQLLQRSQVTLSQLLEHVRSTDQRDAFLRDVIYNTPAPSVASSRSSKRDGLILVTKNVQVDEDEEAMACSTLASFKGRRSLTSGWWDEETDSEDDESTPALTPSKRSIENFKTFDPAFSFSRRCLTSPVESVDPLFNWFAQSA